MEDKNEVVAGTWGSGQSVFIKCLENVLQRGDVSANTGRIKTRWGGEEGTDGGLHGHAFRVEGTVREEMRSKDLGRGWLAGSVGLVSHCRAELLL